MHAGGRIASTAASRTADVIASMAGQARRYGVGEIVAIGTAGLRTATNRDEVLAAIRSRSGVAVEVISGDEEGRLAYLAARSGLRSTHGSLVAFDAGGGSSQFTWGAGVTERFSVPVGSARYVEAFGLENTVPANVVADARAAIAADLEPLGTWPAPDAVVGMGG